MESRCWWRWTRRATAAGLVRQKHAIRSRIVSAKSMEQVLYCRTIAAGLFNSQSCTQSFQNNSSIHTTSEQTEQKHVKNINGVPFALRINDDSLPYVARCNNAPASKQLVNIPCCLATNTEISRNKMVRHANPVLWVVACRPYPILTHSSRTVTKTR